ncbi:MAG: leucine--tRNA ligase [Halobacteriota archaeon]|nr:leucine--tRNA ligase [Halobacteriota archaeon]
MDSSGIEEKWLRRWNEDRVFESNINDDKEKFYINVAYPYPSGAMHVGHGRTYTVPDVIARFKRMQGYEVLFPMAFHVTGSPVIGVSNRIANKDPEAIALYRDLYKVPEDVLLRFTDPYEIVRYFSSEYKEIMDKMGYSIDWRRRFTTVDPHYSKFITWQYNKLREKDLVEKGEHPVKYCLNCDNPVGDHDLLEGVQANISEFVMIKFRLDGDGDGEILPTATLRPETVYGVTNVWANPKVEYTLAEVNNEKWIISEECLKKLIHQNYNIKITSNISGSKLIGKTALNPINNEEIQILPASFVDPDFGTGVVMSVPAHAPFDYVALEDLKKVEPKYKDIVPIPVIGIEGYGEIPAKDLTESMGIENQEDPKLEDATELLYGAEFSKGVMLTGYVGVSVNEARDKVESELVSKGRAGKMYEFTERPVVCRCNSKVYVKILKDQWFLKYSNPDWKEKVYSCLKNMDLVPEEIRADFVRTVGWLNDWACTRRVGLGTPLPWDTEWIVEPLSDSTIYMSYYCIAHKLNKIDYNSLNDAVFDHIFKGKGDPEELGDKEILKELRDEFLYWYPYDFRLSAKDLVSNHLTFQLYHHTAIFSEEFWPRGMTVFGMGLLEGNKMSSSKGNVVLLSDAVMKHGADTVRMFLMGSAEPWQDFDWREELVKSTPRRIKRFWDLSCEIIENGSSTDGKELEKIDRWILSRLQMRIGATTEALESFQIRQALQYAYFGLESDLRWYRRRTDWNREGAKWTLNHILDIWVRLLSPFIPFVCEEIWSKTHEDYVSRAEYPVVEESYIDKNAEIGEELLENTYKDINEIIKVTKMSPSKIVLYTAPDWKDKVYYRILSEEDLEFGKIMSKITSDEEIRRRGKEASKFVQKILPDIKGMDANKIGTLLDAKIDEHEIFTDAKGFLEGEFNCEIEVYNADEADYDPQKKSGQAIPLRPAIFVEG